MEVVVGCECNEEEVISILSTSRRVLETSFSCFAAPET